MANGPIRCWHDEVANLANHCRQVRFVDQQWLASEKRSPLLHISGIPGEGVPSHNDAQLPALPDCLHDMLMPMSILSDRYTDKPLAQGALFQLLPERALALVVSLRESDQAGRVLEIGATGAEDLNPGLESSCYFRHQSDLFQSRGIVTRSYRIIPRRPP